MKFKCLQCGKEFVYAALLLKTEKPMNDDELELHVCPYCQSVDFDEIAPVPEAKIQSVLSVDLGQVDMYLAQGYEVHELYARTATLVKRA